MKRREFITLIGGAAAWPLAARAQQPMPVIGFLSSRSPGESKFVVAGFREGLKATGYREGHNVHIAFRWAEGRYDQLPVLVAELVEIHVTAILAAGGTISGVAAKAATSSIPIVTIGSDPDRVGLVASLNRPGGNVTGVSIMSWLVSTKRLELLRELLPTDRVLGVLINPDNPQFEFETKELHAAADKIGQSIRLLRATTEREIIEVFESLAPQGIRGLVISCGRVFRQPTRFAGDAGDKASGSDDLWVRRRRRSDELRGEHSGSLPPGRHLCRAHSQRHQAGRSAGPAADQIRAGDQPQDRQDAWSHRAAYAARPCRRGDRISLASRSVLLRLLTAGYGTSRTSRDVRLESAKWGKADIDRD